VRTLLPAGAEAARPRWLLESSLRWLLGLLLLAGVVEWMHASTGLPGVAGVLGGVRSLWDAGLLGHDLAVSTLRWFRGWTLGAVVGVCLGFATGRGRPARTLLEGFLVLCRSIPFISLVPLSIRLFGLGEAKVVFLVAWAAAGICWVVVHQASAALPTSLDWRARSLGLRGVRGLIRVFVPSTSEGIETALRTSLALGWIVVAVAESSGVYERTSGRFWSEGLGYRIFHSLDAGRDDWLLASILLFALAGIVGDQLFSLAWRGLQRAWLAVRRAKVRHARSSATPGGNTSLPQPAPVSLEALGLSARYGQHAIFEELDLEIPAGQTLAIVAPSGAGKTTLLRAMAHLYDGDLTVRGVVRLGGKALGGTDSDVGLVMQDAPVFSHLLVWEHITAGDKMMALPRADAAVRALHLLREFGLEIRTEQSSRSLSGGERQRLALATALANEPRLLLLDEPFGALDAITRRRLQEFYVKHIKGRITAVFVTHDISEALMVADRVRVGIASEKRTFPVQRSGSFKEWERSAEFLALRGAVIDALEMRE
jgi:NitT/TauT family transport system ATP-binding protein